MTLKLIKTNADYENMLQRVEELLNIETTQKLDQEENDELELLVYLIEKYEEVKFPMAMPSPVEAIKFKMEQLGLKQVDLIPLIGSKSKVSEVLNSKRSLSLSMIRNLHAALGISTDILLQDTKQIENNKNVMEFLKALPQTVCGYSSKEIYTT